MTEDTQTEVDTTTEDENSAESSTEQDTQEDTSSSAGDNENDDSSATDEDDQPWHKDPRFKEFIDQKNAFGADLEEFKAWKEGEAAKAAASLENVKVPAWFNGGKQDVASKQLYREFMSDLKKEVGEEAMKGAVASIKNEETARAKAIEDANKWFDESVKGIEKANKTKVDRNKLLKFVMDNQLVTPDGKWNYTLGYKFMTGGTGKTDTSAATRERKEFAAAGSSDGGTGEQSASSVATSDDFRKPNNRPW